MVRKLRPPTPGNMLGCALLRSHLKSFSSCMKLSRRCFDQPLKVFQVALLNAMGILSLGSTVSVAGPGLDLERFSLYDFGCRSIFGGVKLTASS